jgi:putative ABC transport system permease protein
MNDFRFAIRQLLKNPGFAAVASLTLALGIGANTAIFSLIDSVLLRALPYPDSDRLVQIYEAMPGFKFNAVSGGAFKDWREHSTRFTELAIYEGTEQNLTGAGAPERLAGWKVSSGFLSVLGIRPFLGRDFSSGEDRPAADSRITILTQAYWQARFGSDSSVIGRTLALDQVPYTIVGVLPPRALLDDQVLGS